MIKFMRSAVLMIACLFAGVGAWAAKVDVKNVHTYASELFGDGHAAISYPDEMTPMVTLTIPRNIAERAADAATTPATKFCAARNHNGSVDVTFTLLAGTFDGNVTGLMWDSAVGGPAATPNTTPPVTATSAIATIEDGGRKGDSHITIRIAEASGTAEPADDQTVRAAEEGAEYQSGAAATNTTCTPPADLLSQTISFALPKLVGLDGALKDASKAPMMVRQVSLQAESSIISGAFTDGYLTGNQANGFTTPVVKSRDAVTVSITPANTKNIVIKGDNEFKAVKETNSDGYVELATVTVSTREKHVTSPEEKSDAMTKYRISTTDATLTPGETDAHVYTPAVDKAEKADTLYDLDGDKIDQGLRGVLTVNAMGTRELFNEGDELFIDYDGDKKMGGSEDVALEGNMGMGTGLAIDPDDSDSFKGGKGTFTVYYMPGGKDEIQHGAMINLMANVDYSDPSATDEDQKTTSTTFNFEGVTSEVMAYAIPQSDNGKMDRANVRVRCESAAGCNVFVECWDDMGMRKFGKAGGIMGNHLMRWTASEIESVVGIMEPTSRHSCRILSAGMVTVQQLTRDGQSGTLVNNTYIGK